MACAKAVLKAVADQMRRVCHSRLFSCIASGARAPGLLLCVSVCARARARTVLGGTRACSLKPYSFVSANMWQHMSANKIKHTRT